MATSRQEYIRVHFWGCRGSVPTPGPRTLRYGGNTPCVEVRLPDGHLVIFDAGTGIRAFGNSLIRGNGPVSATIFVSHVHWDHIQGLPFFKPIYAKGNSFHIAGPRNEQCTFEQLMSEQMEDPHFPLTMRAFDADVKFTDLGEGACAVNDVEVHTCALNHPGGALGYRIAWEGRSVAYVTDNELPPPWGAQPEDDPVGPLVDFLDGTDLLIHDSTYSDEEYETHKGWGHPCVSAVLDLAIRAGVRRYALFHHDPDHSDERIDEMVEFCRQCANKRGIALDCFGAQEGMVVEV